MMFVESKWIYNYLIGKMLNDSFDIFKYNSKDLKTITHKDKDLNDVEVNLKYTGSSIRQALVSRIQSQIKTLSSLKKSGHKVGKLKFKSQYNCIYLKQNNITHKILSKNKIKSKAFQNLCLCLVLTRYQNIQTITILQMQYSKRLMMTITFI